MSNLESVVQKAVTNDHFLVDLDVLASNELRGLQAATIEPDLRDTRHWLWSSIDNAESRDLDQIEYAEQLADGAIRLSIGIADVDVLVRKDTALDKHANANATSVYTGARVFPMLPEELSTNLTSLNENEDRVVLIIELTLEHDGATRSHNVYRAIARNQAKLAYDGVGAWLEGRADAPAAVAASPELEAQLWLQDRAASLLKAVRARAGALEFETVEATAVTKNGAVQSLAITRKNRARDLIEDFMISANIAIAQYLAEQQRSAIRRVVRVPRRWNRIVDIAAGYNVILPAIPDSKSLSGFLATRRAADPTRFADLSLSIVKLLGPGEYVVDKPGPADDQGHFGLAANDYSHATAPNRRYADLVTQRLVKAAIAGSPEPYTDDELAIIAAHCTERENAANHVERIARKAAAALLLASRVGQTFDAIVTGVNKDGTYVRLLSPPAEGRVVRGQDGMDVGERVRVKLLSTDPERGYIDFEGTSTSTASSVG